MLHYTSFNDKGEEKRALLRKRNLNILLKKHPDYNDRVREYVNRDPAQFIRQFIKWRIDSMGNAMLMIMPRLEGGVRIYQTELIDSLKGNRTIYTLYLENDLHTVTIANENQTSMTLHFDLENLSVDAFSRLMDLLSVQEIYVNHLIKFPLRKIMNLIMQTGVPYTFFVHDFYAVCPRGNFVNECGLYCKAEERLNVCEKCGFSSEDRVGDTLDSSSIRDMFAWRSSFSYFLHKASKIYAPSFVTKKILEKYYPHINVTVKEHNIKIDIAKSFDEKFVKDDCLNVSVLGAINSVKGYDFVNELAKRIHDNKYKICIHIIGGVEGTSKPFEKFEGVLQGHGAYRRDDISNLLAKYRTGLVMIPSICPETFSYTTHEALKAGYPVMCFDLGAQAECIKDTGNGWIIEQISVDDLMNKLISLYHNRTEIIEKANNVSRRDGE